jgi:hypothetical protein
VKNIRKIDKKHIVKIVSLLVFSLAIMPNIYFIAGKLGITLAPEWYQDIVDWVSAGGTIAGAFAAILGVTVPAWLAAAAAAFGVTSA